MKISMLKKNGIILFINIGVVAVLTAGCAATAPKGKVTEDRKTAEKIAGDLFLKGKMAEAKKSWAEAITAYTEALQYDTRSDEIAFALAKTYLMDGKKRSSLYYIKMAIQLNPSEAGYWQLLQYLEEWESRFDKAAEALEMYLKLNPEHEFSHYIKLSQYYFALGNKKEARKILLSRAKDKHRTASEIYNIVNILASNGLTEEAVSLIKNLIERDPLDVQAWLLLSDLYENTDREDEALQTYKLALEKNPDNIFLIVRIGNHCLMKNDWNCAVTYFEKAYLA